MTTTSSSFETAKGLFLDLVLTKTTPYLLTYSFIVFMIILSFERFLMLVILYAVLKIPQCRCCSTSGTSDGTSGIALGYGRHLRVKRKRCRGQLSLRKAYYNHATGEQGYFDDSAGGRIYMPRSSHDLDFYFGNGPLFTRPSGCSHTRVLPRSKESRLSNTSEPWSYDGMTTRPSDIKWRDSMGLFGQSWTPPASENIYKSWPNTL